MAANNNREQLKKARLLARHVAEVGDYSPRLPEAVRQELLGGRYCSFREHAASIPALLVDADPPGHRWPSPGVRDPERRLLAPAVQRLMYHCIRMVDDVFEAGYCIQSLSESNVVFCKASLTPKLTGDDLAFPRRTTELYNSNMASLSKMFRDVLFTNMPPFRSGATATVPQPPEVEYLLRRMKHNAMAYRYLIRYHPCLVPIQSRCDCTSTACIPSPRVDVLRHVDDKASDLLYKNVYCQVLSNDYLTLYYRPAGRRSICDGDDDDDAGNRGRECTRLYHTCCCKRGAPTPHGDYKN